MKPVLKLKKGFLKFVPQISIVGAGPSGMYTAKHLLKLLPSSKISFIDIMPTPFGLARFGIAPDHSDMRKILNEFSRILNDDRCSFLGNVALGKDIFLNELKNIFDAVVLAYGSASPKKLNVDGENIPGIHPAISFVQWYNGKPGFSNFSLINKNNKNPKTVVILGNGNVALDCARILGSNPSELAKTEISTSALKELEKINVKEIYIIGRKGPLQSKFTVPELRELSKNKNLDFGLNESDFKDIEISNDNRIAKKKLRIFNGLIMENKNQKTVSKNKKLFFRFNLSVERFENSEDRNSAINVILKKKNGEREIIKCDVVLKSIGFSTAPIKGVPFCASKNAVPNLGGKVAGERSLYVTGWLKKGPRGVILDSLMDSKETSEALARDLNSGNGDLFLDGGRKKDLKKGLEKVIPILRSRKVRFVDKEGWHRIDEKEKRLGTGMGKTRERITDLSTLLRIARSPFYQ